MKLSTCQVITCISFEWGGKMLKREILRLADSLRMTMLIAWSVTSLKVELQELGSKREGGKS